MTQKKSNAKVRDKHKRKHQKVIVHQKKSRKKVIGDGSKTERKPKKSAADLKRKRNGKRSKNLKKASKRTASSLKSTVAHEKKKSVHKISVTTVKKRIKPRNFQRDVRDFFLVFSGMLLLSLLVSSFFFTIIKVNGYSMSPTLRDSDSVLVQKNTAIKRMDLIVFKRGTSQEVRRVIGLPGDRIEYLADTLYVDGNIINEPFIIEYVNEAQRNGGNYTEDFNMQTLTGEAFVPENSYFVLGDNREWSRDSREYGFVSADQLIGVVKMRFLPLNNLTTLAITGGK